MSESQTRWWLVAGALALAVAGVAVYKAWPLLFPTATVTAPLDAACDLRAGPCLGRFPGGGSVALAIEPRGIPPMAPLRLVVDLDGMEAEGVEVDFVGIGMNMGFNRPALRGTAVTGRFEGEGMLPVCVRDRMDWEARVMVHRKDGLFLAPFRFQTLKPGEQAAATPEKAP